MTIENSGRATLGTWREVRFKFSKVNSPLNLLYQMTISLTFENFEYAALGVA